MKTRMMWRDLLSALVCVGTVLVAGCGGGGGAGGVAVTPALVVPAGMNAQALVVDAGPAQMTSAVVNMAYTSVRICEPDTSNCQTIDHVMVDTGSTGLRLLSSELALNLPAVNGVGGALYNCVQFLDQTYMWGAVRTLDLYMGGSSLDGEKAAHLPVQVVGAVSDPLAPSGCAQTGFVAKNTLNGLGARGILGIGSRLQDCGGRCTNNPNNGYYYARTGAQVNGAVASLDQQLQQPISRFASDNNGSLISLPAVPATGAARADGSLVFGIGTQSNNQPGAAIALTFNGSGYFSTAFNGQTLTQGFVDSGSNGWFFGTTTYSVCSGNWYCPSGTQALQATNTGANGQSSTVQFSVVNATDAFSNAAWMAIGGLAGPSGDSLSFDFGLPFFYDRRVFTAIEGANTPLGVGPYVAY